METNDRLESFGIYKLARNLFEEFWEDSELLGNLSPVTRHPSPIH